MGDINHGDRIRGLRAEAEEEAGELLEQPSLRSLGGLSSNQGPKCAAQAFGGAGARPAMPLPSSFEPASIAAVGAEGVCESPLEELDTSRAKPGQPKTKASRSCGLRAGVEGSDNGEEEGEREGAACKVSGQTANGYASSGAGTRPDRTARFRGPRAKPITKALAGNAAFAPGGQPGLSTAYAGFMSVGVGISGVEDAEIAMAAVAKAAKQKLRQLSAQLQAAGAQQAQGGQGGPDKDQLMLEIQIAMAEWSQATQAQSNIRSKADKTLDALVGNLR